MGAFLVQMPSAASLAPAPPVVSASAQARAARLTDIKLMVLDTCIVPSLARHHCGPLVCQMYQERRPASCARHGGFARLEHGCVRSASGADLTFATHHAASSRANAKSKAPLDT